MPLPESVWRLYRSLDLDPYFCATLLLRYQREHGLTDAQLAAVLGCDVDALPHVGLCPRPESRVDVGRIAARFRVSEEGLAGVCVVR